MEKSRRNSKILWVESEKCRKEIFERISNIKELWILKEILKFIINMTKEG